MSVSVRLAELADVAFRTPNSGSVNAGALHLLLRGLLEHLRPQDASTQVSEDERGLLEPGAGAGGRPRALLLQAEGQPGCPGGSPGTAELPTPRQDVGRPGTDSWQTAQLTKRMEVIEEGMTKVTDKLQAMLTTSCSLKTTIEAFQEELQLLKDNFQKAGLEELRERAAQQDKHSNLLQNILGQMAEVRRELGNFPWQAGVLCSLCRVPTGELSSQELSPEAPQEPAQEAPCRLSWLPERHVAVETCISCHENQLQQRADLGTLKDVATRLEKVQGEVKHLEDKGEKGPDFGREVLSQVGQLQEQCTRLQEAAERLWADTEGTQAPLPPSEVHLLRQTPGRGPKAALGDSPEGQPAPPVSSSQRRWHQPHGTAAAGELPRHRLSLRSPCRFHLPERSSGSFGHRRGHLQGQAELAGCQREHRPGQGLPRNKVPPAPCPARCGENVSHPQVWQPLRVPVLVCCHADEDCLLGGPVAGRCRWQDSRRLSCPGGL
ncbi:uncharacterized protein C16orf96 homolog isoform X6 [Cygnus olor]|uniref:uncharacterized protein C16orf96 homolog isoform X6 n=1 Tax=Cygnus olor TaxID=8869 RepID=UPI001ADE889A|nr:uncharacterized protein C16orf96 homolog isoform X6 [Cygnus olor]